MTWFAFTSSGFDSVLCVLKIWDNEYFIHTVHRYLHWKVTVQPFYQQNLLPGIFVKVYRLYERLMSNSQNKRLIWVHAIPRFQTVKWWKENTETRYTLSSSLANMLKYPVLKFSCLYRFVSEVFEIVLRIDGVLRKLNICPFFFFLSWELCEMYVSRYRSDDNWRFSSSLSFHVLKAVFNNY